MDFAKDFVDMILYYSEDAIDNMSKEELDMVSAILKPYDEE